MEAWWTFDGVLRYLLKVGTERLANHQGPLETACAYFNPLTDWLVNSSLVSHPHKGSIVFDVFVPTQALSGLQIR